MKWYFWLLDKIFGNGKQKSRVKWYSVIYVLSSIIFIISFSYRVISSKLTPPIQIGVFLDILIIISFTVVIIQIIHESVKWK